METFLTVCITKMIHQIFESLETLSVSIAPPAVVAVVPIRAVADVNRVATANMAETASRRIPDKAKS